MASAIQSGAGAAIQSKNQGASRARTALWSVEIFALTSILHKTRC